MDTDPLSKMSNTIACDGCGLPASAEHIAERLERLELATRFRPIHINILFVAASPSVRPEDDFYRSPKSREFFDPFMEAVEISAAGNRTHGELDSPEGDAAKLAEFQRRGYYLAYLSECPLSTEGDAVNAAISRLGSTLIRRVNFNYKPRQIAILGDHLRSLRDIFEKGGIPSTLFQFLETPKPSDTDSAARFRAALANPSPGIGPV